MLIAGLTVGIVGCAVLAIRAARLLSAALWLACTSALVSILLFLLGGHEIAVIELSVGAGLVTVLFIFALNLVGEQEPNQQSVITKPLAVILAAAVPILLGLMTVPLLSTSSTSIRAPLPAELSFSNMLWQQRGLDVILQIGVIFAGVLGILGLLSEVKTTEAQTATTAPVEVIAGDESNPPALDQAPPEPEMVTETEQVEEYA